METIKLSTLVSLISSEQSVDVLCKLYPGSFDKKEIRLNTQADKCIIVGFRALESGRIEPIIGLTNNDGWKDKHLFHN